MVNKGKIIGVLLFLILCLSIAFFNYTTKKTREGYSNSNPNQNPNQSSTVDQPINTTTSCENICGPPARCSVTGEQCTSDIDCYGCQPPPSSEAPKTKEVRGQNDAGKLTLGVTPTYSSLTTDIGTQAAFYDKTKQENLMPPQYFQGVDQWRHSFDVGMELYDKRYNPSVETLPYLPKYQKRPTLSGEFMDDGPLAANDFM